MEEYDSFFNAIQEILFSHENEESILNQSLYEKNPIKHVISEKGKEELTKCKYKDALNKKNYTCCCITQDEFLDDDDIIQLPCEHCFFPEPIIKWLTEESSTCPMCKTSLDSVEVKNENKTEDNDEPFYNTYNFSNTMFLNETFFDTLFINSGITYDNSFFVQENNDTNMDID
jgi:hypothetical protein